MNDSDANSSPVMLPKSNVQAHQHQQQQQQYSNSTTTTSTLSSAVNQNQQHTAANLFPTTAMNQQHHQAARNHCAINNNTDMNNNTPMSESLSLSSPILPSAPPPREGINTSSSLSPMTATILDAPILDDYLLGHILLSKLRRIVMELFDNNNSNDDHHNHTISAAVVKRYGTLLVSILLYPAIHLATTLATHGQTPAVRILGLERKLVSTRSLNMSNDKMSTTRQQRRQEQQRLILFSLCTTLGPVLLHALKDRLIRLQQQYQQRQHQRQLQLLVAASTTHDHHPQQQQTLLSVQQEQLAAYRQFQMATLVLQILNRIIPLVQLALVLNCWKSSNRATTTSQHFYNTSELAMMLTGFTYQKQQQQQQQESQVQTTLTVAAVAPTLLHVTYAHRRWLWDEMARTAQLWTRGLTILIPIWKPLLKRYFQYWRQCCWMIILYSTSMWKTRTMLSTGKKEASSSVDDNHDVRNLQQQQQPCPICHVQPITVPVTTDCCGHAYCYVCLYQESIIISSSSSSFGYNFVPCRICGQAISQCQRKQQ